MRNFQKKSIEYAMKKGANKLSCLDILKKK